MVISKNSKCIYSKQFDYHKAKRKVSFWSYPKTYNPYYDWLLGEKLQGILDNPLSPIHQLCDKGNLEKLIESPKDYGMLGCILEQ